MKKKLVAFLAIFVSIFMIACGKTSLDIDKTIENALNGNNNYIETYSAIFVEENGEESVETFVTVKNEDIVDIENKLNEINFEEFDYTDIKLKIQVDGEDGYDIIKEINK